MKSEAEDAGCVFCHMYSIRMMHAKCVCCVQVSSVAGECKKSETQDAGCVFYRMCQDDAH